MIGSLICVTSLPLFFFPSQLRHARSEALKKPIIIESTKDDIIAALKRFAGNKLLIYDSVSRCMAVLGYGGYYMTQPKYIESQYNMSASKANFASGTIVTIAEAAGSLIGGTLIWLFRPGPRTLCTLIMCATMLCSLGVFSGLFLGCPEQKFQEDGALKTGALGGVGLSCSSECACSQKVFQPVCSANDKVTNYFSPCFAGCADMWTGTDSSGDNITVGRQLTSGFSDLVINLFLLFAGISALRLRG